MLIMMRCAQWGFIFWAGGLLTFVGLPGFVRAGDLKEVQSKVATVETAVKSIQADLIEARIYQTRISQCATELGTPSRSAYAATLADLLKRYRESAGKEFRLPACDEVR